MPTKEQSYQKISQLVENFNEQIISYKKSDYNETQVRREFIDPFFKALGWDIDNEQGLAESYKEVIHEDKIKVGTSTRAPDYCFTIYGQKKFFVEAKKPSVSVKDEILPAYQVRRYGWSAKLPISIITDFEEFAIYDCTKKPSPKDSASVARIRLLTYQEYLTDFNFLWDTFSKEKVLKGSFDKFVQSDTYKKGTADVDKEFLQSLEEWRTLLAKNIAVRNSNLNEDELNFVVQQTLDRIIFLRICEDRNVEPYENLKKQILQNNHYQNLFKYFLQADDKYNSGIFNFKKDKLSPAIKIDDKIINKIIDELYYPQCPYEFSVLPVAILGNAYEQFLGKVIRITPSRQVKIEEKPEVRKAGGVYYTPQYIVDYIVKNTVGKLIENKSPAEISKIKIVDPACGSGSFLLGAYQYLLNYHLQYYLELQTTQNKSSINKDDNKKFLIRNSKFVIPLTPDGNLTTAEKKRILINNIFGVDIDAQAVEVTKLSLLLKCMEGETASSIKTQLQLFSDRILPTLDNNIKCGNSLIGPDFYEAQFNFEPETEKKIKPFDWEKEFAEVFKTGGFDCVIGNPPYVDNHKFDDVNNYFQEHYKVAKGQFNLFSLFVEKSFSLIKKNGFFSFIIPSLFIKGVQHKPLRDFINQNANNFDLKEYGDKVFENVKMPTCIFVIKKGKNDKQIDYFIDDEFRFFNKIKIIKLNDISIIKRGLEIGKDKLKSSGKLICITGGNIDSYTIKSFSYIDEETYKKFQKDSNLFKPPKLLVRETGNKFFAVIDFDGLITTRSIYNVKLTNNFYSLEFILGLLNSNLYKFYFKKFIAPETKVFPKIRIIQLKELPIPQINFSNPAEKSLHNELVKLVDLMLTLNKELQNTKLPDKQTQLKNHLEYTDKKIDELVYKLYGLTEEEIRIVEGK